MEEHIPDRARSQDFMQERRRARFIFNLTAAMYPLIERHLFPRYEGALARLDLPPLITKANCKCLAGSGQFEVFGKCFVSSQGNRVLRVNGTALPTVLAWQNKTIRCGHAYDFPGGVTVHVDLFDTAKNKRVSNLFDYLLPFCITQLDPAGPLKQKSHVTLLVKPDVGVTAAGRKVMIGGMEAHADWMVHKIVFVVPLMTPGSYTLLLKKDGQIISNEFPVTVE